MCGCKNKKNRNNKNKGTNNAVNKTSIIKKPKQTPPKNG